MQNKLNSPGLKLIFAGTPEFGLPALEALYASPHTIAAVYTQPDRSKGRGQALQYSPIKAWALAHDVPVMQPEHFKSEEALEQLRSFQADVMVVIAYGLILPKSVLCIPKFGCLNVHASLLPAWRGASPIQSAILHGDPITGVTIMQMDKGMDTGDILSLVSLPLTATETAGTLHDKLSQLAVSPLLHVLSEVASGTAHPVPQAHEKATYASKIDKEDAHLDWSKPAQTLAREVRAYQPWPVSYTFYDVHRIRVFEVEVISFTHTALPGTILKIDAEGVLVATGDEALRICSLQFPGGKRLAVSEWLRGHAPLFLEGHCLK